MFNCLRQTRSFESFIEATAEIDSLGLQVEAYLNKPPYAGDHDSVSVIFSKRGGFESGKQQLGKL